MRRRQSVLVGVGVVALLYIFGGLIASFAGTEQLVAPSGVDPTAQRILSALQASLFYVCTGGFILLITAIALLRASGRPPLQEELDYILKDHTIRMDTPAQTRVHKEQRHMQEDETLRRPGA